MITLQNYPETIEIAPYSWLTRSLFKLYWTINGVCSLNGTAGWSLTLEIVYYFFLWLWLVSLIFQFFFFGRKEFSKNQLCIFRTNNRISFVIPTCIIDQALNLWNFWIYIHRLWTSPFTFLVIYVKFSLMNLDSSQKFCGRYYLLV